MEKIISRKHAIELGLKKYFTGNKCLRGHLSERTVYDKHCILCKRIRQKIHREKNGPYKSKIKQHLWNRLSHVKYERKSINASKMEIKKEQFYDWFDRNYRNQCEYCEISLEKYENSKLFLKLKVPGHRFGIDRKNSLDNYNLDNIAVCCSICNSAKSFIFEAEEFKEIAKKYIRKLYG